MSASEADDVVALRRLGEASDLILDGVERELPGWVQRQVTFILDAWGRLDADARSEADRAARVAV